MSLFRKKKKKIRIPQSAQDTIPFIEVYENGLFLTTEDTYTLIFAFTNIDYTLMRENEQSNIYEGYQQILNSLPTDIRYQEFIMNKNINKTQLERALLPTKKDEQCSKELFDDYHQIMNENIRLSEKASSDKVMIASISYTPYSKFDTPDTLFKYYNEIQSNFNSISCTTTQLMPEEVLEVIYNYYHSFDDTEFLLPKNIYANGNIKDYIAPSMFTFKPKEIEIGESFTRVLFLRKFDREIDDRFITDLLDNNWKVSISKHIKKLDKGFAIEKITQEIFDVQRNIQTRKSKNHKSGGDFIPFRLTDKLNELEDLQNRLSDSSCELFEVGVFVSISARTKEDLEELTKEIVNRAIKHQVKLDTIVRQQEYGLHTMLPFAINYFNDENRNNINTYLLSDATGMLIPFSANTYFTERGIFYGMNQLTRSAIILDRTNEMNSNGYTLGTSGSGKSMFTKSEIWDVFMHNPNDELIVIDPENEYADLIKLLKGETLKIAPNSKTNLNFFDTDLEYSEEGMTAVAMKSNFIMTVIETIKSNALTATERSKIDACINEIYKPFINSGGKKEFLPTLTDFYENLKKKNEPETETIANAIELYVSGSFNNFAGKTNIDINNRFLNIDISNMGEQLGAVGLQVILEFIWQRVIDNKKKGVRTWVWIDEFSVMFQDEESQSSGKFFQKVYKRIRKHGGVITGITQNISEVLESKQARTMIANTEFVVLLQQKKEDLNQIVKMFDLSPSQISYINKGKRGVGSGLIICGNEIIPFQKLIPKTSLFYESANTTFTSEDERTREENV